MSAAPQPSRHASVEPVALPPPTPPPPVRGVVPLLLGGAVMAFMIRKVGVSFYSAETTLLEAVALLVYAVLAAMMLSGVAGLLRSAWRRARAGRHPHEPWRWDYPWRRKMVDPRLSVSSLLLALPGQLLFTTLSLAICGGPLFMVFWMWGTGGMIVFGVVTLLLCAFILPMLWRSLGPYLHRWGVLLRYGRMCLRLPGIPLALGTRPEVELAFGRDVPHLTRAQVTLRRVSERRIKDPTGLLARTTVRQVESERAYEVRTEAPGPRQGMFIPLELPPPEVAASTWMEDGLQIYWEVNIASTGPGLDLDTTFRLPVYLVPGTDAVAT